MTHAETALPRAFAEVYVERVSIHHFRGIAACDLELEPDLTVLVGRNNIGKSRVLSAIQLALGGRPADIDDFTVGEVAEPTIDIVVAPAVSASGTVDEAFDASIAPRFGRGVQTTSEEPFRERFAWRTHIRRSAEGLGARSESKLLTFDDASGGWVEQANALDLARANRSVFAVDLVNTGRDLMEELSRRGSGIRRVLSDLEVADTARADLEQQLAELGTAIVSGSRTLASIRESLERLHNLIGSMGSPDLSPLPISLEELSRSISIGLDSGEGPLPIRMHGAGSRSLASLQVQGVLYEQRLGSDGPQVRPHPVTLVEEPEAHLHPQASVELAALLNSLRGQKVVSTHSPQLVTAVEPRSIRILPGSHPTTVTVVDLGPAQSDASASHRALRPSMHVAEMEKLKRLVERPFGELLFANALVIGDGATERGFLPPVLRHALGSRAHGVCVIDPESLSGDLARAAVKFATLIGMPWLLFADSDGPGRTDAMRLVADHGDGDATRIVWVMGEDDAGNPVDGAIETMLSSFDASMCRAACAEIRPGEPATTPILDVMAKAKGQLWTCISEASHRGVSRRRELAEVSASTHQPTRSGAVTNARKPAVRPHIEP